MKRILITLAALVFGLLGLGMSLCGGGFLLTAIIEDYRQKTSAVSSIAAIAVPALVVGVVLTVVCFKALMKQSKDDPPP